MLATALDAMATPMPPLRIELSKISDPQMIRKDLLTLFVLIKKATTQFSLAVRPESKGKGVKPSESEALGSASDPGSPLAGLPASSLTAAKQQIDTIANDLLPKIIYLMQKARLEADVYEAFKREDASDADPESGKMQEVEELARQMGGMVMSAEQLGLAPTRKGKEKDIGLRIGGLGGTWAAKVRSCVLNLVLALRNLAEAAIDERTRNAMLKAAQARAGGAAAPSTSEIGESRKKKDLTPAQKRERILEMTAAVWERCDLAETSLPLDVVDALLKDIEQQRDFSKDALRELKEAIEEGEKMDEETKEEKGPADPEEPSDSFDDDFFDSIPALNAERLAHAKQVAPLMRIGDIFLSKLYEILSSKRHRPELLGKLRLDGLSESLASMSEQFDVIIDEVVNGEMEESDLGEEEDEGSDADEEEEDVPRGRLREAVQTYISSAQAAMRLAEGKAATDVRKGNDAANSIASPLNAGAELSKEYLEAIRALRKYPEELERTAAALEKEGVFDSSVA